MELTLRQMLDALLQHIPSGQAWMPTAGVAGATLFGLILMLRGARLAPFLAACVIAGLGGVGGSFAAHGFNLPVWPMIGALGVVGFIMGLVLFRFWLAALIGVCFAGAGLGVYGVQVLAPHIATAQAEGITSDGLIALPDPNNPFATQGNAPEELGKLWTYLTGKVQYFQASFIAIAIATVLAGFTFGLFLPTASRALFAATGGTFLAGCGVTAGLQAYAPSALTWLQQNTTLSWGIVGVAWFGSLLYNMLTCGKKKGGRVIDESAPAGKAATA